MQHDGIDELDSLKQNGTEIALALSSARAIIEKSLNTHDSVDVPELMLGARISSMMEVMGKVTDRLVAAKEALKPTPAELARIEAFQNINTLASHMNALATMEDEIEPLRQQVASLYAFNSAFKELRRETMGKVLKTISNDVCDYFLYLHPKEGFDDICLKFLPEEDGVEFHVYYKGEEITPPRKFLSESYLNGLGVCLFLATVRSFNKENKFVVLDDIVNSFDSEHRADLARLLVNEFEDYQLIVLTHDEVWFDLFRRLTQKGWQHKRIRGWTYELGIDIETTPQNEFLDCKEAIKTGRIDYAAPQVRGYIENRLKALSMKIGVRMRFRQGSQNDERTSGELLAEMRRHLGENGFFGIVDDKSFRELEASNFIVNYGSHDRTPDAAGLVMGDVEFALERLLDLEPVFICPDCSKPIWNLVDRNFKMQCKCGKFCLS
jgi:wobble nucleotide-excising tRNase